MHSYQADNMSFCEMKTSHSFAVNMVAIHHVDWSRRGFNGFFVQGLSASLPSLDTIHNPSVKKNEMLSTVPFEFIKKKNTYNSVGGHAL